MDRISAVDQDRARFMQWFTRTAFRLLGWKLEGVAPEESKYVAIFAPHTSNWDAVLGLGIRFGLEERPASWILKESLYRWPFRRILLWLGAIPIDRSHHEDVVGQIVEIYNQRDTMVLGITPEGTRKRVSKWRTGFYWIAHQAGVPILMCYVDFKRKVAGLGPLLRPSGDVESDLKKFAAFYANVTPKYPENRSPVWEGENLD